jgi:hypothetical protein
MPIFDPMPIFVFCFFAFFFLVHSSSLILLDLQITKIKMPTNIYCVPIFFFLGFLILPHFFIMCSNYSSSHTHVSLSLCQDDMPRCHYFLYQQIAPTQFSFVEKNNNKKSKEVLAIVAASGQSCRYQNSRHSSQCQPKSPMSKYRPQ